MSAIDHPRPTFSYVTPFCDEEGLLCYEVDASHLDCTEYPELYLNRHYFDICWILSTGLGFNDFLPGQLPAIHASIHGKDVFVALPPGSGKSVTFVVSSVFCHTSQAI